jgi:hypothetical protein
MTDILSNEGTIEESVSLQNCRASTLADRYQRAS